MVDASVVGKEISSTLRRNDGLTAAKFANCPALLGALGTADPAEALQRFTAALERLPDDKFTGALKNAFRLDPSGPENVTGHGGRRIRYAEAHSVSEETVKQWEQRAIETLAHVLTSQVPDELYEVAVIFSLASDSGLMVTFHLWKISDTDKVRVESREYYPHNQLQWPFAAYQLGPDERPKMISVSVLFNDNELPESAFGFGHVDLFDLISRSYEPQPLSGPYPAADLWKSSQRPHHRRSFEGQSHYSLRWFDPKPLGIYGIAWS